MFAGVYAVGTPVLALATASVRRFRLLMALYLVFLVGNVLTAVASSYSMLAISRAVSASVSGAACTVSVTFVKDIAPERMRPKVIAVIFAGFSVASVLGVPLGTFVAQICGWNATFWLISAMLVATVLVLCARCRAKTPVGPPPRGAGRAEGSSPRSLPCSPISVSDSTPCRFCCPWRGSTCITRI